MTKVCHLSSAHRGLDVRIYHKECVSLAAAGFDTHLVINATEQEVAKAAANGVTLHALSAPAGRFSRMAKQAWRCYQVGRRVDADIYHFHDSELIPYGILLALSGKKVIYDVHEDVPEDILTKDWIPLWARKAVAGVVRVLEDKAARHFVSVIAATPFIAARFQRSNPHAKDINNYPLTTELTTAIDNAERKNQVCYIGGISRIRGIRPLVEALPLVPNLRLVLCGEFGDVTFKNELAKLPGWSQVDFRGHVDRAALQSVMAESAAGIVTFLPIPNHTTAQPNKMFEYMCAGIPVIASNFPLWREIIEGNQCGLCVDPLNPTAIAQAIGHIATDPENTRRMGRNGRRAVAERCNWSVEETKLIGFYKRVLSC